MRNGTLGSLARMGFGIACLLALAANAAGSEGLTAPSSSSASLGPVSTYPSSHGAGLIARLDGDPAAEDAPTALPGVDALLDDWELAAALSTSSEGLYEEAMPGGGVMVRLQGRFSNALFATTLANGSVQRSHRRLHPVVRGIDPGGEPRVCRPLPDAGEEADHATP